jgi:hypothetical protein
MGGWADWEIRRSRGSPLKLSRRVAGEPTVWIAQKDHAYRKRKVPKRDDRSHANTLTVAPHICILPRGSAQV